MDAFARLAAMSALLGTTAALQAQPFSKTIYVDATAPAGGDGTSWNRAFKDLADACSATTSAIALTHGLYVDMRIAQGTYRAKHERVGKAAAFEVGLAISSGVSIVSGFSISILGGFAGRSSSNPNLRDPSAYVSVLTSDVKGDDGPNFANRSDNAGTVLGIWGWQTRGALIDGLTFRGGNVREKFWGAFGAQAGGLSLQTFDQASTVDLVRNCRFEENSGVDGGGLAALYARVERCEFSGNQAAGLGGGLVGCDQAVIDCSFSRNRARSGGAAASGASMYQCRLIGNSASERGGGVYSQSQTGTAYSLAYVSCLFAGNSAGLTGGALSCSAETLDYGGFIANCTIVNNKARWGGGVHAGFTSVEDSIVTGNQATTGGNQFSQADNPLSIRNCVVEGGTAGIYNAFDGPQRIRDILDVDPRFEDPAGADGQTNTPYDNNYRLRADSPCIDRGGVWYGSGAIDLDGLPRFEIGISGAPRVDLGCYEWRQICPADFDNSGGTPDTADLAAFFEAFSAGDAAADVNKSGGTPDSDDIEAFFNVWLAGGC